MNRNTDDPGDAGTERTAARSVGGLPSLRNLETFAALKSPVYRVYYGAMSGQWIGMNMQMVTRSLLVYRITGSGAILGLIGLSNAIPLLMLSFFGGAVADRVQKKYILLACQAASAVVSLLIAIALTTGYLGEARPGSWWILITSSVVQGVIMGLMMPARQAIIPEIIGTDRVMNAISLNNMGMNFFQIVSPALAGFCVDAFGFAFVYYLCSAGYVMASIFASLLPHTRALAARTGGTISDIFMGMAYVRRETTILLVLTFGLVGIIFMQPYRYLMPMMTEDILQVGATEYGLIMMAAGIGAIMGSVVLASLPNRRRGIMLLFSGIFGGIALASFSFCRWWYPCLLLMVMVGIGQSFQTTLHNSLVQYYVEDRYRGRVMSFVMMGMGVSNMGVFFGGMLAESIGVQWSLCGLALCLIAVSVYALVFVPRLRRLQ